MKSDDDYLTDARERPGRCQRRSAVADETIRANRSLVIRGAEMGDTLTDVAHAILAKSKEDRAVSTIARRITALYGPWRQQKAGQKTEIKDDNYGEGESW